MNFFAIWVSFEPVMTKVPIFQSILDEQRCILYTLTLPAAPTVKTKVYEYVGLHRLTCCLVFAID